jgi:pyridoxamine 5'-phosphate oxidase
MDFQDYVEFATEHPVCYLATMDGDQPRVRSWLLWFVDDSGFYFVTMSPKEVVQQLKKNPKVELVFFNNAADPAKWKQMRVTGEMEILEEEEIVEKGYEARSFLDPIVGYSVRPFTQPLRLSSGEAHFWTLAGFLKESELERIPF